MKVTEAYLIRINGEWQELIKWSHENVSGWVMRGPHGALCDIPEANAKAMINNERKLFEK